MAIKSGKKGLFMTILILILFLLILGELLTFALLNVNYNSLDQSLALGSSSINYGKGLSSSANLFAAASLSQAIKTLANYELNVSMRKGNLISNTTQYLGNLVVSGTLPNVAANTLAANFLKSQMNNLTLASYNLSLSNSLNLGALVLSVNQSRPQIYQKTPYSLTISYVENIALNSSGGRFRYQIPVNATISLNNTPDLFYYQQGIPKLVRFGSQSNLTNLIGGINATNGNFLGSAYGPVYNIPTGSGGLSCASLSTMITANVPAFSFAPYNQMLILLTPNAIGITGSGGANCASQYGGLITYSINSLSSPPTIPWLLYASSTNLLGNVLKNGQQALIFGNTLSVYNIQNLITAASSGYYFASPFTPSYLDSAQSTLPKQNPNGIFTLQPFNYRAGSFNGVSSYVPVGANSLTSGSGGRSVFAWIYPTATGIYNIIFEYGTAASDQDAILYINTAGDLAFDGYGNHAWSTLFPSLNSWHLVGYTYSSGSSLINFYMDGQNNTNSLQSGALNTIIPGSNPANIGFAKTQNLWFHGSLSNVQAYNWTLTGSQTSQLYQEGISGLPVTGSNVVGWWPLNGNGNDYSGQANNGVAVNVVYSLAANYVRDSIISATVPTSLSPVPGLLNCNSNSQCTNTLQVHSYLGYMPLQVQQLFLQTASFNALLASNIVTGTSGFPTGSAARTMVAWVNVPFYTSSGCGIEMATGYGPSSSCNANYAGLGLSASGNVGFASCGNDYTSSLTPPLNTWSFIAVVYASGATQATVYLNTQSATGALSGGNVLATPSSSISSTIGEWPTGCNFNGKIANVQIYGNALSSNQITALYNEGISGLPLQTANSLVGWWPLNGNPNDYSGNGQNGVTSNTLFTYLTGTYNSPGLSSISGAVNEWQAIGLPRSGG